jgi:hypothetical protein
LTPRRDRTTTSLAICLRHETMLLSELHKHLFAYHGDQKRQYILSKKKIGVSVFKPLLSIYIRW